ncbi:MAG TPA: hypothetical protein VKK61_07990 [Tepidisphaeraceae bacterium]|nr:hypothetical protein [Tepidisphaeraceae bacterium]
MPNIEYAGWASVLVSVIAFGAVVVEYRRQTRRHRLEIAQNLIEQLDEDDMLRFAVTTLDWGAGLVIIPESWRSVIDKPSVEFQLDVILDALRPELTSVTARDPLHLLYRHSFVRLFNHLERISVLLESGAVDVNDLQPIAFVAHQLLQWSYASVEKGDEIFREAMKRWYPDDAPNRVVTLISKRFPQADAQHQ